MECDNNAPIHDTVDYYVVEREIPPICVQALEHSSLEVTLELVSLWSPVCDDREMRVIGCWKS